MNGGVWVPPETGSDCLAAEEDYVVAHTVDGDDPAVEDSSISQKISQRILRNLNGTVRPQQNGEY
jgi:hypothetical protein